MRTTMNNCMESRQLARVDFYLSSHDAGEFSPGPWECMVIREINGVLRPKEKYLLVKINPGITVTLRGRPACEVIVLSVVGNKVILDIESKSPIGVDIVKCPAYLGENRLNEKECIKLGSGHVHSTFEEARKATL